MSGGLCIAIMAAGAGSRFEGGKLDAEFDSKCLGRHAVDAALGVGARNLVIVVGDRCPAFANQAQAEGIANLLVNREARQGLARSIGAAVRYAARTKSEKLLLMLGDMPFVTPMTLRRLADAATAHSPAAALYPGGKAGIPACLTPDQFEAVLRLKGDRGAASYLNALPQCVKVDIPVRELTDIDTRTELAALSR